MQPACFVSASLACCLAIFSSFVCFFVFLLACFFYILLALAASFLLSSASPLASCLSSPSCSPCLQKNPSSPSLKLSVWLASLARSPWFLGVGGFNMLSAKSTSGSVRRQSRDQFHDRGQSSSLRRAAWARMGFRGCSCAPLPE